MLGMVDVPARSAAVSKMQTNLTLLTLKPCVSMANLVYALCRWYIDVANPVTPNRSKKACNMLPLMLVLLHLQTSVDIE